MEKDLRKKLGIDDWLELVKEDRNCNGAYISFGQYMYLLEKENQKLKKQLEDMTLCRDIASGHRKEVQDREFNSKMCQLEKLKDLIIKLKNQPTVYLTKYMDEFGFVETKTLNELIEELEKSDK